MQGNLKLKVKITVRRISHYFSSFPIRENGVAPYSRVCGNVMSINTTRGSYGASSSHWQCRVCQPYIEGSEDVLTSPSQGNQSPSFYSSPMPNPLSNQKQLPQLRIPFANTFLSDHYLLSCSTLSLNISVLLLDPWMVFLLKGWLCDGDSIISLVQLPRHSAISPDLASFKPWGIKASAIFYIFDFLNYKFSVIMDLTYSACIHMRPEKLRRTNTVHEAAGPLC